MCVCVCVGAARTVGGSLEEQVAEGQSQTVETRRDGVFGVRHPGGVANLGARCDDGFSNEADGVGASRDEKGGFQRLKPKHYGRLATTRAGHDWHARQIQNRRRPRRPQVIHDHGRRPHFGQRAFDRGHERVQHRRHGRFGLFHVLQRTHERPRAAALRTRGRTRPRRALGAASARGTAMPRRGLIVLPSRTRCRVPGSAGRRSTAARCGPGPAGRPPPHSTRAQCGRARRTTVGGSGGPPPRSCVCLAVPA